MPRQPVAYARHCAPAGSEVWFDQSELRGGDAWDQKIRHQIRDCALFIPIISAHTASRPEGYFRLEWAIADQRTQMIARNKAFIVPVCIDGTPEGIADLPDSFHRAQWTRLPQGETPPSFCQRVATLLGAADEAAVHAAARESPASRCGQDRTRPALGTGSRGRTVAGRSVHLEALANGHHRTGPSGTAGCTGARCSARRDRLWRRSAPSRSCPSPT